MKGMKMTGLIIGLVLISLIAGIIIGNCISGKSFGRRLFLTPYNKINVVLDIVHREYVDPIAMNAVTERTIPHILKMLDPYSVYISKKDVRSVDNNMKGYCGGIGIDYSLYRDTTVVVHVVAGGAASKAGLLPGDRIISINGFCSIGVNKSKRTIMQALCGNVGSSVKLEILRNSSNKKMEFEVKRKKMLIPTVKASYEIEKGIGFLKIEEKITRSTYNEFLQATKKLLSIGCKSFIMDLRTNKGGSYEAATKIINEFLPLNRLIVYAKGKSFSYLKSISNGKGILQNCSVVILIDKLSASASEMIAGSIQDNDRGLIVGTPSFGKGLIQDQIELSDGSMIKLTIARYYIPSGRSIQREYTLWKQDKNENINRNHLSDTTAYHTLYGRPVYSKSGITPDIIVVPNISHLTYYNYLEEKNIFDQFAFEYSDTNRKRLTTFKNDSSMLEYLKTQPLLEEIIHFALRKGVRKRTLSINYSANQILNTTYAWILNNFFGDETFYQIYLRNDPVVNCAIQAIKSKTNNIIGRPGGKILTTKEKLSTPGIRYIYAKQRLITSKF